ncbi:restriction endonuclease subunit S [Rubritalea tangerina]|uniref:Restriction endonuclease subunit S n=1 Tax=Rubritalea tangerina TaxID=430798 RepID=A0ABW4ZE05_9BACT
MSTAEQLITEHLDLWTSTIVDKKSSGRGGRGKRELYGIKKLRELILELAVRGLLVPQDPNEEPASKLIERISAKKDELIKSKLIKKTKPLPNLTPKDHPFIKPKGWEFIRLGDLTSKLGSGSTPRGGKQAYTDTGIIFLRSQNIWNDGIRLQDIAYIPESTHDSMSNTKVRPHDVLLNITGASLGRSTIFPEHLETANVSQHVTIIRLLDNEMARFVHTGILAPMVQRLVWGRQVGMAIEGLSKKVLELFEFPLPPLAEQKRIVAKVDELMALCDQLEQQTEDNIKTHETLVKTLLDSLTSATADAEQFQQAWSQIEANFDLLFTTESSIDHLKQAILQLAVMGKLVRPACRQAGKTQDSLPSPTGKLWWAYVIECEDGSFYKGHTEDLPRRWKQHCAGSAADWTKQHPPKQLFYWEECGSKEAAIQREKYLKSGSGREWFKQEVVDKPEAWEPASELLKRIAETLPPRKGNRSKNIADVASEPFELPSNWSWARFPQLGEFGRGKSKHRPRNDYSLYVDGTHKLIQTGDVARSSGVVETHTALYNEVGLAQSRKWPKGTLCITIAANIADSGILSFDACFPDSVVGFIPSDYLPSVNYFEYFLRTAKEHLESFAPATAQKNINLGILEQVMIPLPPAIEQHRIVAKVDELMALCDALKAKLQAVQATQHTLTNSIVEQAAV